MILKNLIPEILLFQFVLLNHGAHCSVQQDNFFVKFLKQHFQRTHVDLFPPLIGSLFIGDDPSVPGPYRQNNLEKFTSTLR